MDSGTELIGERPGQRSGSPMLVAAKKGEGDVTNPLGTSPGSGRQRDGRATAVKPTVGRAPVRSRLGLRIGARRSGGEAVGGGDAEVPFYSVGGGAGCPGDGE
jgi:hypothetical protein